MGIVMLEIDSRCEDMEIVSRWINCPSIHVSLLCALSALFDKSCVSTGDDVVWVLTWPKTEPSSTRYSMVIVL